MSRDGKMLLNQTSFTSFAALGAFAMGCVAVMEPGCGGSASSPIPSGEDGGSDGATPPQQDATISTEDSSMQGGDSGEDSAADSGLDATQDAAPPPCTGAETACVAGATAGLCVGNLCLPCNSPTDDSNCSTAYGDGGTGTYVCNTGGSCVPGNCNVDSDCTTAGEICGVTMANVCGACTSDSQCQSDPTYGPNTICNVPDAGGGTCISSVCTTASTACGNPSDFCCATGNGGSACVPGNCCVNADCQSGVCGGGGPNLCGPCTSDSQCAAPTPVCDTTGVGGTTGACVATTGQCSGTPGATGGAPGTCAPNASDMCCPMEPCIPDPAAGASGEFGCCPGAAGDSYCQSSLGNLLATCSSGDVCTTCLAVSTTAPVYVVDPVHGTSAGTGSGESSDGGATEGCALLSITRAIQLINAADPNGTLPTTIVVVGGTNVTVGQNETFPIILPKNVTITTSTGPVTVQVPNGKVGFELSNPSSVLTSANSSALMTITTTVAANSGTAPPTGGANAIRVLGNASSATTTISNVAVTGMLDDGILVTAVSIAIGPGVSSAANGIMPATRNGFTHAGLHVTGEGAAVITGTTAAPTTFNGNSAHGILVDTDGSVTLTGTPGATQGTGTVETNANQAAGMWIQQTPSPTAPPPNAITGLVSFGNTSGNGVRIVGGSNVTVRGSVFLGNSADGVIISTNPTNGNANDNDISLIDLGDTATSGGNTFQAPLGAGNNGNAGVCLDIAANSGETLLAVGNTFRGINCAAATSALLLNSTSCNNNAKSCAGGVCDLGFGTAQKATTPNAFNVSQCTQ